MKIMLEQVPDLLEETDLPIGFGEIEPNSRNQFIADGIVHIRIFR